MTGVACELSDQRLFIHRMVDTDLRRWHSRATSESICRSQAGDGQDSSARVVSRADRRCYIPVPSQQEPALPVYARSPRWGNPPWCLPGHRAASLVRDERRPSVWHTRRNAPWGPPSWALPSCFLLGHHTTGAIEGAGIGVAAQHGPGQRNSQCDSLWLASCRLQPRERRSTTSEADCITTSPHRPNVTDKGGGEKNKRVGPQSNEERGLIT